MRFVHDFLAVNRPVGGGALFIEAWIPQEALHWASAVCKSGNYSAAVVVAYAQQDGSRSKADVAATTLVARGCRVSGKVVPITLLPRDAQTRSSVGLSHRTLSCALAAKAWLQQNEPSVHSVDVLTVGVHARKSWILARHAFGESYNVGIIAAPEPSYNPNRWLASPRGVWLVGRNVLGYVYATVWGLFAELKK